MKKIFAIMLAMAMVIPTPLGTIAAETGKYADNIEADPVKLPEGMTAEDFIKNPEQPDLYTLRSDYKVERDGEYFINFQPYVATVGQAATEEEQNKVNKKIKFPEFSGYGKPKDNGNPIDDFLINYKKLWRKLQRVKVAVTQNTEKLTKTPKNLNMTRKRKPLT